MEDNDNNSTQGATIEHVLLGNDSQTVVSDMTPHSPIQNASQINIGQHPTPEPMRITINESQFEEGYDSDGQLGPFYDAVRGEEVEGYYEEAIEVIQAAVPVSDA